MKLLKDVPILLKTHGLDNDSIKKLLFIAKEKSESNLDIDDLYNILIKYEIDRPGLILQAAEKYFNGLSPEDCVLNTTNSTLDTLSLCKNISKGDWSTSAIILKNMKKEDIIMVKNCILGYLKTILLNSKNPLNIAKAMKTIDSQDPYNENLPGFVALLCIACSIIKGS